MILFLVSFDASTMLWSGLAPFDGAQGRQDLRNCKTLPIKRDRQQFLKGVIVIDEYRSSIFA